jgi:malate dehydrogenase (oxaloacetate-decarboxylating)(NADP+)
MVSIEEALEYHSSGRKGKIEVVPTKPCITQRDLSLAYTPGVAEPCRVIHKSPDESYNYTAKGNLVAVITNGTAVLGLGNIGPLAGKPVMEGKAVLFKRFADIDVFDLEVDTLDPDEFCNVVKLLEPTFGGINLEDIKAPECFYIEKKLMEEMDIPIFHDDQHGTAIISGAALLNALEIVKKDIDKIKVVYSGAGAAGIACAELYISLGVKKENMIMCDSKGVIYKGRDKTMNPYKERFAIKTDKRTIADALEGADVFVGVSIAGLVTKDMVKSMNDYPIVFAMANPDPEITYEDAKEARDDVIMATGRSDYPNQVNNVLGFPFIFRGALDVRSKSINDEMKIAAVQALANLAKEDVPDAVRAAYGVEDLRFSAEYIIPKPVDHRVLLWEAPAVAEAAIKSGVAGMEIDIEEYKEKLEIRLGKSKEVTRSMINKASKEPKRIVFPEGEHSKIIRACNIIIDEGIARPILLGSEEAIRSKAESLDCDLRKVELIDPSKFEKLDDYTQEFYKLRHRRGITPRESSDLILNKNYFGSMMVHMGDADGLISGLTQNYPDTIKPALQVIRMKEDISRVSGLYILILKEGIFFFADTTVNINPTAEHLAEIAIQTAETAKSFDVDPRIAMLSFSNFGSTPHSSSLKVREAVELVKKKRPDLPIDGEMQADTAVVEEILTNRYPFSDLKQSANVLIFPHLDAGNIAYKLMMRLGGAEAIGPILQGMRKSVHVLQRGAEVSDIVNMTAIAVVDAQKC